MPKRNSACFDGAAESAEAAKKRLHIEEYVASIEATVAADHAILLQCYGATLLPPHNEATQTDLNTKLHRAIESIQHLCNATGFKNMHELRKPEVKLFSEGLDNKLRHLTFLYDSVAKTIELSRQLRTLLGDAHPEKTEKPSKAAEPHL